MNPPSQLELDLFNGKLHQFEHFWARYQPFLLRRGYALRPRYQPDWVPTWHVLGKPIEELHRFEDSVTPIKDGLLDATRLLDNRTVVLKRVKTSTEEIPIGLFLSSDSLSSDPRNNAVPILDVLLLPDDDASALIVMPLLYPFDTLPFRRVGEFAQAVHQFTQGLLFMHEHNIAHRDPCLFNLMVDATGLLPQGWHFLKPHTYDGINLWMEWRERNTCKNLRYYFVDFGLSRRYTNNQGVLDVGINGQDLSYPERSSTIPYDPFKTDIYHLGNAILEVVDEYDGLRPFRALGQAMTQKIPEDRASLKDILALISRLNNWRLRSRVWRKDTPFVLRFLIQYCRQDLYC